MKGYTLEIKKHVFICTWYDHLYKQSKASTKVPLELINEFNKFTEDKYKNKWFAYIVATSN